MTQGLAQFGDTRQRLLRQLLLARDGAGVEELCECLRITHNAVRQHLTTLIVRGLVERVQPRATGGRPQARYVLTAEGRELFPRNYGPLAAALISPLPIGRASWRVSGCQHVYIVVVACSFKTNN